MKGVFHIRATLPCGLVILLRAANTPTDEGIKEQMDILFNGNAVSGDPSVPPPAAWLFGFVATAGFVAYARTDTLSSHPGWVEDASIRVGTTGLASVPAVDGLSALKERNFSTVSSFSPIAARGIFLATTLDDSGLLWATADFDEGPQSFPAGTQLDIAYPVTLSA